MDLKPIEATPSDEERAAIDGALATGAPTRDRLLPVLRAIQARVGHISAGALAHACARLQVPPAEAWGVATFYHLLSTCPTPRTVLHVCDDVVCHASGAEALIDALEREIAPEGVAIGATGATGTPGEGACWKRSPCLGQCERAPAALRVRAGEPAQEHVIGALDVAAAKGALAEAPPLPAPARVQQPREGLVLLARVGVIDPTSLDDYRARGGFSALRRAHEQGAAWVIREVTDARLLGRGGAGFPTGRKWGAVAQQPTGPRYVVCNADESEPGTFKDRVLIEEDPFALVEAVTIAAFAVSAERAFVYVRGEYPLAAARLEHAIAECRRRGLLGDDVMGRGLQRLEIEVRRGAGAYICGEETALLESLEGRRGEPRAKPPFPVEQGLFGKPTLINNVETLVAALAIVRDGATSFTALGTEQSAGPRLFCLSGDVARPGVYEAPMGLALRDLLAMAGGPTRGIGGVLLGGAAGTFLGPDELDLKLTFEDTRRAGATLGSGVVVVLREGTDFRAVLHGLAGFFRHESCGQCVPCRVGTIKVDELLARVRQGRPEGTWDDERARLRDLGHVLREASICGLGQTAASALESAVKRFPIFPTGSQSEPYEGERAPLPLVLPQPSTADESGRGGRR
jgi:NADH-quinone oxidoreductase subunit F